MLKTILGIVAQIYSCLLNQIIVLIKDGNFGHKLNSKNSTLDNADRYNVTILDRLTITKDLNSNLGANVCHWQSSRKTLLCI